MHQNEALVPTITKNGVLRSPKVTRPRIGGFWGHLGSKLKIFKPRQIMRYKFGSLGVSEVQLHSKKITSVKKNCSCILDIWQIYVNQIKSTKEEIFVDGLDPHSYKMQCRKTLLLIQMANLLFDIILMVRSVDFIVYVG